MKKILKMRLVCKEDEDQKEKQIFLMMMLHYCWDYM